MFSSQRYSALLAVPVIAYVMFGIVLSEHPILAVMMFPPALQLPFYLVAAATGRPRAIDAALISTRFTAMLMIGGGIVLAIATAYAPALFVSFLGGMLMLAACPGNTEVRLAACLALTGGLLVLAMFFLAWCGVWLGFAPAFLMLLSGCTWAIEATFAPRSAVEIDLPRAVARFSH